MKLSFYKTLRIVALIEGISTLMLFGIAMPLKYWAGMPMAVKAVGSIHGILFIALVILCLLAVERIPISKRLAVMGIISAVFPFGPFIFDHYLIKAQRNQA